MPSPGPSVQAQQTWLIPSAGWCGSFPVDSILMPGHVSPIHNESFHYFVDSNQFRRDYLLFIHNERKRNEYVDEFCLLLLLIFLTYSTLHSNFKKKEQKIIIIRSNMLFWRENIISIGIILIIISFVLFRSISFYLENVL